MALEGNVDSFGLSEILQLIAVQQKTGMLTVSASDKKTRVFFFKNGQVMSTRDRRRRESDPFLEYLTRYGILDQTGLGRLDQICAQSKLDMLEVLVSEDFMSADELEQHWRRQIQESMHEVLTWDQCSYKFMSSDGVVSGIRSVAEFNIEGMLMECMRRIDEQPRLRELYPHNEIVISRGDAGPGEGAEMTSNERAVFELVTKPTTIRELIAHAGLPEFEVYEAIRELYDKSMLVSRDDQALQHVDQVSPVQPKPRRRPRLGNPIPLIASLILLVGAASTAVVTGPSAFTPAFKNARSRVQVDARVRWALEAYRATHGVYPQSLKALVSEGLATSRLLDSAEHYELKYRLTSPRAGYTL